MKPFILNRTDERRTKSTGRILLYAMAFFMICWGITALLVFASMVIYLSVWQVNPQEALSFFGDPAVAAAQEGWWALPQILLFAPLFEECAFRLGLSFRKWHVVAGLGALAVFVTSCVLMRIGIQHPVPWGIPVGLLAAGAAYFFTAPGFWESKRARWQRPMMWASAVLFALAHLVAMQGLTWFLLPYALALCLMLFTRGCVFVYLRVNLGFWWAVGAHVVNNLVGALVIIRILLG